jgi:hypothetical protein
MKKLNFNVEIEFEDKITDDIEIEDISVNILNALISEVNSGNGLAPENSDTYTNIIKVTNNIVNSSFEHKF